MFFNLINYFSDSHTQLLVGTPFRSLSTSLTWQHRYGCERFAFVFVYCIYSTAVVSIKTIGWLRIPSLLFISSRLQGKRIRYRIVNSTEMYKRIHSKHTHTHTHKHMKLRGDPIRLITFDTTAADSKENGNIYFYSFFPLLLLLLYLVVF